MVRWKPKNCEGVEAIIRELKRWVNECAMKFGEVAGIDPRHVRQCMKSLTFPQIYDWQSAIERPSDETCAWIFEHHLYQAWSTRKDLERSHGILWIKGKPGSGKSTLMRFLAKKTSPYPGSLRLLFFFNPRGTELERSVIGLY
jgi:polynucleotide 5'-kinase involved in rRNA processing